MAKRPRKSSKLKDAEVFLGDVSGLSADLSSLKASRKKKARTPHPEEDFVGDPNPWSDARKKEEIDYLEGPSIPEMPGPIRPMEDRIAQALNDPNATAEQIRFRRELAESHPEVFWRLMNGEDPGTLAHLVVAPSIESKGPSKAARALRERQEGLARRKLSETQAAAQVEKISFLRSTRNSALASGGLTGEEVGGGVLDGVPPSFPEYERASGYEAGGSNYEDVGRPTPTSGPSMGPATEGFVGPQMGAAQLKNRGRLGRGSRALDVEEILQAAGVTKPGMLNKAAASLVSGVGLGRTLKAGATPGMKQGMVGRGLGWAAKQAVHSPIGTGLTALMALQMLAPGLSETVTSPVKGLTGGDSAVDLFLNSTGLSPGQPVFSNRLANQGQLLALQDQMRLKAQRDAQTAAQNTALLFQTAPHVAAQIMAGRRLPKGAVVIGGTPRVDLMQEMAMSMGQGQFQQTDPMQEILERQQGGAM